MCCQPAACCVCLWLTETCLPPSTESPSGASQRGHISRHLQIGKQPYQLIKFHSIKQWSQCCCFYFKGSNKILFKCQIKKRCRRWRPSCVIFVSLPEHSPGPEADVCEGEGRGGVPADPEDLHGRHQRPAWQPAVCSPLPLRSTPKLSVYSRTQLPDTLNPILLPRHRPVCLPVLLLPAASLSLSISLCVCVCLITYWEK